MKKLLYVLLIVLLVSVDNVFASSASLTWNANTESDMASYRIYRGNGVCAIGPLQPLVVGGVNVSVLFPLTTYTDTTVPVFDGNLCYEITAVDTAGNESAHSIRASKTVNLVPPVAPTGLTIVTVTP